jgi:hypothetical protein
MAFSNGLLMADEVSKVRTWLSERNIVCPVCHSPLWDVAQYLGVTPAGPSVLSAPQYHTVILFSKPCGYLLQFRADAFDIRLSQIPPPPPMTAPTPTRSVKFGT